MKLILKILLFVAFTAAGTNLFAQADPTTWTYELKKKAVNDYELIFHLSLQPGWHIWSLNPGGDGYEISPSFTFDNNSAIVLKGKPTEKGTPVTTIMKGIDGKITYFTGKVDYVQEVTVQGTTKITGKYQYQICNNNICLPPTDKSFQFELK